MRNTSLCSKTILGKNILRFAPLWGSYLVCGILVILSTVTDEAFTDRKEVYITHVDAAWELMYTASLFSIISLIYAALCGLTLFGDLFDSRRCEAIHAIAPRREALFLTHLLTGLCFAFVPNLIMALAAMPFLQELWYLGFVWLLAVMLEFLCFFGLAVFSVFCAGNRIGMLITYTILNFGALVIFWFIAAVYEPMMYGVVISEEHFLTYSPASYLVLTMMLEHLDIVREFISRLPSGIGDWLYELIIWPSHAAGACLIEPTEFVQFLKMLPQTELAVFDLYAFGRYMGMGDGWGYLIRCAVVGVILFVVSLLMYRRRNLECAGDLLAVKWIRPVFAVVLAVCISCMLAVIGQQLVKDYLLFVAVGLIIGWFAGQMLLRRTVKVFQLKTFFKLGLLILAFGATLTLTHFDAFGIVRWVPDVEKVETVEVYMGWDTTGIRQRYLKLEDQQEIQKVTEAHEAIVEIGDSEADGGRRNFTICYTLENGMQVTRRYWVYRNTEAGTQMQEVYNGSLWD